jgi:hypothetical protein
MQELLVGRKSRIVRVRRQRRRPIAGRQILMMAIDSTMVTSPSWIAGMDPAG